MNFSVTTCVGFAFADYNISALIFFCVVSKLCMQVASLEKLYKIFERC